MSARPTRKRTREDREERAERILDVTGDLVLRWGYRKTTLEDIARGSQVAKGTLFLHWPHRDALFVSLLRRERLRGLTSLRNGLEDAVAEHAGSGDGTGSAASPDCAAGPNSAASPDSARAPELLYGFLRRCLGEILTRPLIRATLVGDENMLGRLTQQERPGSTSVGAVREFGRYLEALRDLGVVRTDLDLDELLASCTATLSGFLLSRDFPVPVAVLQRKVDSGGRYAELGADALCRVLRPSADGRGTAEIEPGADLTAEIARATIEMVDRALAVTQEGYRASLEQVRRTKGATSEADS